MTYAIRNTLLIAGFWAAILAAGFLYVFGHQVKLIEALQKESLLKQRRLQDLLALEQDRSSLQEQLVRLEDFRLGKMGTLAAQESPGETFDYLLRELSRTRSGLDVNFSLKSQDVFLTLARRTYEISGSGSFSDFYKLLWFLESGPIFYDVHHLEMEIAESEAGRGRSQEVNFLLTFNGYDRAEGPAITGVNSQLDATPLIADLVNARPPVTGKRQRQDAPSPSQIPVQPPKRPIVRQNNEGLPEVGIRTQVLAIMPGVAVLKDQSGRMVRLKPGDRVFGGTLSEINAKEGTVQFSLQDESGGADQTGLASWVKLKGLQ